MEQNDKKIVLFHANWCGHCKTFKPMFEQVKAMFGGKDNFEDIESGKTPEDKFLAGEKAKVQGYPTIIAYNGGSKIEEYNGDRSKQDFSKWVSKILGIQPSASKSQKYRKTKGGKTHRKQQKRRGRKTVKGGRR